MGETAVVISTPPLLASGTAVTGGPRRISPAAHLAERFAAAEVAGPRAVSLREVPFLTMVGLRTVPGTDAAGRLEVVLGTSLPNRCGSVSTSGDGASVLWLSPDEFLVITEQPPAALAAELAEALGAGPGAVLDLSANRTTFALAGPSARAVLEKGCPLDLHPRSFVVGTAYLTLIGSVPVMLWKIADDTYRILPRSSYADFLGRWLIDAMQEFAVTL
jgi:sarcosine oxidase subunit gamma